MREIQFREILLTLSQSNTILTESKQEVQKTLICSKSREGTAESNGAKRFRNTSVAVQQIIVTNARNGKFLKANMRNKIRHEKAILCGSLLEIFSKSSADESRRFSKTLSGFKDFERIADTIKR